MKKYILSVLSLFFILFSGTETKAQQYKIRQVTNMMGMKTESTVYVKGQRKRTEGGAIMGMGANIVTIEQCDLQRAIKINDKKKLYVIIPFAKEQEEVIDEDAPAVKTKPAVVPKTNTPQKGGTITMWYNITDTGERKKIFGLTARHVWTFQKMKPSPDACSMKDSFIIKTDGWYIDLPQFNCPVPYRPAKTTMNPQERPQPECQDKFVTRRKGKGKLGFPITETTTFIMGDGKGKTTNFETNIETLELTTSKLDSMLFEIPLGYTQAQSEDELQEKMDINSMMKDAMKGNNINIPGITQPTGEKAAGKIRVGVYLPTGEGDYTPDQIQQRLAGDFNSGNVEGVVVTDEEDAKRLHCDYTLSTEFTRIKSGSKVGGLLKAIKNTDPNAASSFNIQAGFILIKLDDGSVKTKQNVDAKFEGKINEAAGSAADQGARKVLDVLQ